MIRRPGRLHKRRTPTIFPADAPPARRPRGHPERLDHVAARFHRRRRARRPQGQRRPGRRAARQRGELRHGGGVHTERAPGRTRGLRRRTPGRATGPDARGGDERAGRERLHRRAGLAAARAMAEAAEQAASLPPRTALVLSTGVIGVALPLEQVANGLRVAAGRLTPDGGPEAARAIMTTDTRPKHCAVRFETPAGMVTVGGIAKGAGMIHPDMATLLAVLTTDAVGEPAGLQPLLRRVADRSFNAISVDGDTSTNDTVLLLAGGASGVDPSRDGALWKTFEDAVLQVARTLALAIVSDGEGASKLVEIHVVGGGSEVAARDVGRAIARSTLVKTAIYGADPNWGRILAAAGAAGVPLAVDRLSLQVAADGEWLTLATGGATAHADPRAARAIFQQKTIRLRVDLGLGRAEAVVWTCDLTPDYVRINADYTS